MQNKPIAWGCDRIRDMRHFYTNVSKLPRKPGFFAMIQRSYSREKYARMFAATWDGR